MMTRILLYSLFLLLSLSSSPSQEQVASGAAGPKSLVQDSVFHSGSLGRNMHYRVLLPGHYQDGGRFPVLYLLHGLYGDYLNWDTRTGLEGYARGLRLLIILPDAGDSWYTNSATVSADKFEDYIAKDLISEVDEKYHTIADRQQRAIAGLSMGGYGALKLGIRYPNLFSFAGSLSGALNAAQDLDTLRPAFRAKLLEVYGSAGSRTRTDNDIFQMLKSAGPAHHPYFYLACGASDFFLPVNREFVQQLSSAKLAYEYHETPGEHSWEYWDGAVQPLLRAIAKTMAGSAETGTLKK
jgi:S-formylglutathione hydrolase FrmB